MEKRDEKHDFERLWLDKVRLIRQIEDLEGKLWTTETVLRDALELNQRLRDQLYEARRNNQKSK